MLQSSHFFLPTWAFHFRSTPMVLLPQQSQQASPHILAICPQNSAWLQLCWETWTRVTVWGRFTSVRTPVLMFSLRRPITLTGPSPRTTRSIRPMLWSSPGLTSPPMSLPAEEMALTRRWASSFVRYWENIQYVCSQFCLFATLLLKYSGWNKLLVEIKNNKSNIFLTFVNKLNWTNHNKQFLKSTVIAFYGETPQANRKETSPVYNLN